MYGEITWMKMMNDKTLLAVLQTYYATGWIDHLIVVLALEKIKHATLVWGRYHSMKIIIKKLLEKYAANEILRGKLRCQKQQLVSRPKY